MDTQILAWKAITRAYDNNISEALQQQHHAAQFIALVGRYLLPHQANDSNTNMEYIPSGKFFQGNAMPNGMRVSLQITSLVIIILDTENSPIKVIPLNGKTQQLVFDELKQSLSELGVDVSTFKNELHYKIPPHALNEGEVFSNKNENDFIENANYRHNADIILNEIAGSFNPKEPVRIWPHHFDSGAFFVLSKNKNGSAAQTIGIGFAIPDGLVDEPYYYLSYWSEKPIDGLEYFSPMGSGKWMMPNWNGAVLKVSEIMNAGSAKEQVYLVKTFFNQGIAILLNHSL